MSLTKTWVMRGRGTWFAILLGAVLLARSTNLDAHPEANPIRTLRLVPRPPPTGRSISTLEFRDFYRFGTRAPDPSSELLSNVGKRFRLVGFMAHLESPVVGGFYLAPYPASCDESGAGRGDLPPTSVLVLLQAAAGKQVAFVPGALEVTGVLEVGNAEVDGESSTVRLIVNNARDVRFARTKSTVLH